MRKTEESLISEFNEVDNPFQGTKEEHTRRLKSKCMIALCLMSNILTFTAGYYVKYKYFNDDCLTTDGGSM